MRPRLHLVVSGLAAVSSACTQHAFVDTIMTSAYRSGPLPSAPPLAERRLLAGDFHCHVSPPDAAWDVTRDLADTVALAHREGLDFLVLTPHVPARFFADPAELAWVVSSQRALRSAIASADTQGLIVVAGFEYTDHEHGHVGMAFADLEEVVQDAPPDTFVRFPERFFDAWVAHGGTMIVNHPLVTPIERPVIPISMARADLSWRPWTRGWTPAEIAEIDALATGWEVYNLSATHLRDRYLLHDPTHTLVASFAHLDAQIARRRARMTPVGGSDSHGEHLRATTFVRVSARSPEGLRAGLLAGRTCVRDPAACSLEARSLAGPWVSVGGSIEGADQIELRARGTRVAAFVAGHETLVPTDGHPRLVDVRTDRCIPVRAVIDGGYSAPIYVNCRLRPL